MFSGNLNNKKCLFVWTARDRQGMGRGLLTAMCYLLGCMLLSLWINLGSAGLDVDERLMSPRFVPIYLGTVLLLLLYAVLINAVHDAVIKRDRSAGWGRGSTLVYFGAAMLLILSIHALILEILLPDSPGLVLLSEAYLLTDFWFFFPVLLTYIVMLYRYPEWGLLQEAAAKQQRKVDGPSSFSKPPLQPSKQWMPRWQPTAVPRMLGYVPQRLLGPGTSPKGSARVGGETTVVDGAQQLKTIATDEAVAAIPGVLEPTLHRIDSHLVPLLTLWKQEQDRVALMRYLLCMHEQQGLSERKTIRCYEAVIIIKGERTSGAYLAHGMYRSIKVGTKVLMAQPWLVKLSAKVYVNMLYFRVYANRPTELELYMDIRQNLGSVLTDDKLKAMTRPSPYLQKNLNEFWGTVKALDENDLYEEFALV